jgi:hypothetical protein
VDHHRLVGEDPVGGDLEADQRNDEGVGVGLPPSPLAGGSGDLDQLVALRRSDPVQLQHVADVPGACADLAGLDPGDLRAGAFEGSGDLFDGLAGVLSQLSELDPEAAALNRRAWPGRHRSFPPASGSGSLGDHSRSGDYLHLRTGIADCTCI